MSNMLQKRPTPVITARAVEFSYGAFPVLTGADFSLAAGEATCLTGDNGCGKSTFLKLLIGELTPQAGTIQVLGRQVEKRGLRHLGYVPQANAISQIAFPITSLELATQGLARDFGVIRIPRRRHREHTLEVFAQLGLEKFAHVPFSELSGGLQQRVMIARALLADPHLLVLDEPTAGVDAESRVEFLRLLDDLCNQGVTLMIVTHDVDMVQANMHIDTVHRMEEGRVHVAAAA